MSIDGPFALRLVTSFLVGGLWVTMITLLAQRFGSKLGGIVAGIPSTLLVSLFFVGLTDGVQQSTEATTLIPASLGSVCALVIVYSSLVRRGLPVALIGAFCIWTACQFALTQSGLASFPLSLIFSGASLAVGIYVLENVLHVPSVDGARISHSKLSLVVRGIVAGLVVASAVAVSRFAGPQWAGILSAFPAAMFTTLWITYQHLGPDFSRAVAKTHMISGVFNCIVYSAAVRYLYPSLGLGAGTVCAYALAIVSSGGTYWYAKRHLK